MSKAIRVFIMLSVLVALSWGVYKCRYYVSYARDLNDRPWAFSSDTRTKLLVGSWQGNYKDPNGVTKRIRLEIMPPVTGEERAQRAARRPRKRNGLGSGTDKKRFDGLASVISTRGRETYEFNGHVLTTDGHTLGTIHFSTHNEIGPVRNNFDLHSAIEGGTWQDDQLTLTLTFTFITNTGSAYSSSADPRYDKKVRIYLSRLQS